ncbi:otopetrin, putative [Schistosoma mansoni]|uniref:otopetrin, putative n=1 Tax=Schistosoma mansoni TaxID=6183 RepID=UPI00022C82A7|nr:otopetrin, putative [Schistosoma mansoni]|eukprot:XP_018647409.1 otopetrin, putative [Schistosoma mansoni]
MAYSGYSTDNSDSDQTNTYPLKEKSTLKKRSKRNHHRKRFGRMAKSWKFMKLRKLWERDMAKQRSISAPFVSIKANNKYESMTASLLFMFAITQCIFGFVLPICDSFGMKRSKLYYEADHKYYLEIFLISQYCGAILVLAYLQYLIYSGTKKQIKQKTIHELSKSKTGCELVDDKHMIINEHHELSEPNILMKLDYMNNSSPVSPIDKLSDIESTTSFGLGVMIHDGFNLSSVWEVSEPVCHSKLWIPKHIIRIVWVLWQTYFVFKYHRVILHRHLVTVRLSYIHLATINFCHWLKVVVSEVALSLKTPVSYSSTAHSNHISNIIIEKHNMTHISLNPYHENHTPNSHYTKGDTLAETTNHHNNSSISRLCLGYLGVTVDPFLYPLAIEYSLITGSFFYKMLQRLDQTFPKSFNRTSNGSDCLALNSPSLFSPSPLSTTNSINKIEFDKFLEDDVSEHQQQQQYHPECIKHMTYRPVMGCKVFLPLLKKNRLPILNEHYSPSIVEENKQLCSDEQDLSKFNSDHQCHRSHTGLFLGIMLLIGSIICMVLFLIHGRNKSKQLASYIYQNSKLTLSTISLLACIMGIIQTNQLKFHRLKQSENFEYNLLTIGLIGCITYHMFLFIPALETIIHIILLYNNNINNNNINNNYNNYNYNYINNLKNYNNNNIINLNNYNYDNIINLNSNYNNYNNNNLNNNNYNNNYNYNYNYDFNYFQYLNDNNNKTIDLLYIINNQIQYTALLYLIKCTLEICQALIQFFFIVETSRRKVCCLNQSRIKPGRSIIVFLLICNLALWLVNTFEVRSAETQLSLYRQYFGVRTWSIITYCFIPLIIFFRFHSTVCLAELWTKLYTLK